MSAILLHHDIKTTTPFADALVQERLAEFLPCHDNCSSEIDWGESLTAVQGTLHGVINLDLSPDLAATCLAQRTGCSHAAGNIACFWPRASANGVVVLTPWCCRMAEYRAHVQIIFKHWFHDEIRPGFIMWLWFCVNFVLLLSVMNYCRATFEIMTRIHQMAPLLYIINFSKLRFRVKDERTLISAKNRVDLSSISEVRSYITERPRFLAHPV